MSPTPLKILLDFLGFAPPGQRDESQFDAGSKYHVAANSDYVQVKSVGRAIETIKTNKMTSCLKTFLLFSISQLTSMSSSSIRHYVRSQDSMYLVTAPSHCTDVTFMVSQILEDWILFSQKSQAVFF